MPQPNDPTQRDGLPPVPDPANRPDPNATVPDVPPVPAAPQPRPPHDDAPWDDDEDVPFRLPLADDALPPRRDQGGSPVRVYKDATDVTPPYGGQPTDADAPHPRILQKLGSPADDAERTVPAPPDAPQRTLPGSGGLDPNPDMPQTTMRAREVRPAATQTMRTPAVRGIQEPPIGAGATIPSPTQPQRPISGYGAPPPVAQPAAPPPAAQRPAPGARPQPSKTGRPANGRAKATPRGCLGIPSGCLMVLGGVLITFCGGLSLISLVLLGFANARVSAITTEGLRAVDEYEAFASTFYYDRNGTLLYEDFNEGRRIYVPLSEMPQALIDATISLEDRDFYNNIGIDVSATTRAFLQYVGLQQGSTGGSTITQQLVRNIAFDYSYRTERSVRRKLEEIVLAVALNQRRSKDEILELYLNEIYYGNRAYGVEAAAQTYFGKPARDLTVGEAALLAGLPQAPADLDPLNPDPAVQQRVLGRWRIVLDSLVRDGRLSTAQRTEILRQGLTLYTPEAPLRAPHAVVFAQNELEPLMGTFGVAPEALARGGYRVTLTVDLRYHDMAQAVVRDQVSRLAANRVGNGAVIITKPQTGEILAMVGSADYNNDAIDGRVNVTIAQRQPGSTIKALTYAAALEQGMSPTEPIWDTRVRSVRVEGQPEWPRNYDRTYHGPVNMRTALANSYNVPAVKLLQRIGVPSLLEIAARTGIRSLGSDASRFGLSLTLGGGEVTLLELTRSYSVFATGGTLVPTTIIACVQDNENRILYEYEGGCRDGQRTPTTVARNGLGTQVLDPRVAFMISEFLADNAARSPAMGGSSPLRTDGIASSVKTGTTDDVRDNWTVGYTRSVAVGVWVGNSDGTPMVNSSGLTGAAPIWNQVLRNIYSDAALMQVLAVDGTLPNDQRVPPPGLSQRQACNVSALRDPATDCTALVVEWFLDGPAGRPDGNGGLAYPAIQPTQAPQPSNDAPFLQEVSPGVYRVAVHPLPPGVVSINVPPGAPQPPPPVYCQIPFGLISSSPTAREQVFLAPPPLPEDAAEAEQYARNAGLAFLPTVACSPDLLSISAGPTTITAFITQPAPGQEIPTEGVPILGTVQFAPGQVDYYKFEIRSLTNGQFPGWTTINDVRSDPVVNGQLGFLPGPPGLQPGEYELQLAVVAAGNYVQQPYVVPFSVR